MALALFNPSLPALQLPPPCEQSAPLLAEFLRLTACWREVFPQARTFARAQNQALGGLLCLGRRTITRILSTNGRAQLPWAADYFLHARCQWKPQALFETIWREALPRCKGGVVGVALDDTRLRKTGRCIRQAFFQRDPLSPPFHVNLMLGLRFLQASLLLPLFRGARRFATRALPVRFSEVSCVPRPGKRADAAQVAQWKAARKKHNLSMHAAASLRELRAAMDRAGGAGKTLIIAADGSFCNKTCFKAHFERTELLARCRKDAALCRRATGGGPRFYSKEKFTPEQVRKDESIPWQKAKIHYGGKKRPVRYKELSGVLWQRGAGRRQVRLIVLAPTPYRKRKSARFYYRQPAYLLTTDLQTPAKELIQIYFDRWQIEVNHREEKDTLGIGQAQVWNVNSVPRQPVLAVAAYSALSLAAINAFGPTRTAAYALLPKWRSKRLRRPSCLDLLARLRTEAAGPGQALLPRGINLSDHSMVAAAAA